MGAITQASKKMRKAKCHKSKKHYAKDLCRACWDRQPEQIKKGRIQAKEWRSDFRKRVGELAYSKWLFERNLKYNYKLSTDQYKSMFDKQNGLCPCGEKLLSPHVDHNHGCCPGLRSCGKCVRGLLCRRCNFVLGLLNEDLRLLPEYLKGYLREFSCS